MSYKNINPDISEIKTGTPAIKIGDKYVVGGIGGNFIPQVEIKEKEVTLGQVNADGDFQPLAFNGTEASNSGSPETVESYYGFNGVLPVPESGGGATGCDFYKCASVDTTAKTWTGYKASLTDGDYTFEETLTDGLSYGTAYTPTVGEIYSGDTMVKVYSLFTKNLVPEIFAASFDTSTTSTAPLSIVGTETFGEKGGVSCLILDGSTCLYNKEINVKPPFTIAATVYWESGSKIVVIGPFADLKDFEIVMSGTSACLYTRAASPEWLYGNKEIDGSRWAHIVCTYDGDIRKIYVDSVLAGSGEMSGFITTNGLSIGRAFGDSTDYFRDDFMNGGIRKVQIYDRVLEQDEIDNLYENFLQL